MLSTSAKYDVIILIGDRIVLKTREYVIYELSSYASP